MPAASAIGASAITNAVAPWDIAAVILLILEAGGIVTNFAGETCPIDHTSLVAGSAQIHAWLLNLVVRQ